NLIKDLHREQRPATLNVIEALGDLVFRKAPISERAANPAGDRLHAWIDLGAASLFIQIVGVQPMCRHWPKTDQPRSWRQRCSFILKGKIERLFVRALCVTFWIGYRVKRFGV